MHTSRPSVLRMHRYSCTVSGQDVAALHPQVRVHWYIYANHPKARMGAKQTHHCEAAGDLQSIWSEAPVLSVAFGPQPVGRRRPRFDCAAAAAVRRCSYLHALLPLLHAACAHA